MKEKIFVLCMAVLSIASIAFAQAGTLPAQLDWSNPNTVDGIQVEKGGSLTGAFSMLKQLPANALTYTDATNNPGTTSCYRLGYFNTSGIGPYAGPVCKTFPAVPSQTPATFTVK